MKLESAIEVLKERTKDFTTYPSIGLMCKVMEDYAFQQAVEFTDWYRNTAFEKTMYKDTQQLYEQFMLERNPSNSNNKPFVKANVSNSVCKNYDNCENGKKHEWMCRDCNDAH